MDESQLRRVIREMINEDGLTLLGEQKVYDDGSGYKFQVINGNLTLTGRPKGSKGPTPLQVPTGKVAATVTNLLKKYPGDPELTGLSKAAPPAAKTGLELGTMIGMYYPVTAEQILSANDFIHPTPAGVSDCSAWAAPYVGLKQGNAWIAARKGTLKFNAFGNLASYKGPAETLFGKMNGTKGLSIATANQFKAQVQDIVQPLVPKPTSLKGYMQIGDIIGMYYPGSLHHGEAFFESCSGWSLTRSKQEHDARAQTKDGRLWDASMIGQKLSFVITKPFTMNTHLGFVGGTLDGEPIIFHNVNGSVHVNRLSKISSAGAYPVWVKQGGGGGIVGGYVQGIKDLFSE